MRKLNTFYLFTITINNKLEELAACGRNSEFVMASQLKSKLAPELIDVIKLYTGEAYWQNNKIYYVNKIPWTDSRYAMLKKLSLIKQVSNDYSLHPKRGSVWFKVNGKFMVITTRYSCVWNAETHAYTFGYFTPFLIQNADLTTKKIIQKCKNLINSHLEMTMKDYFFK